MYNIALHSQRGRYCFIKISELDFLRNFKQSKRELSDFVLASFTKHVKIIANVNWLLCIIAFFFLLCIADVIYTCNYNKQKYNLFKFI